MKITNFSFWLGLSIALIASPTIVWADEVASDISTSTTAIITTSTTVTDSAAETSTTTEGTSTTTLDIASSTPETSTTTPDNATSTLDTASSTLTNTTTAAATTTTSTTDNTNTASGSGQTNQIIPATDITSAVQKILNYLKSQQNADGKILDGNMTDWAMMSFGADEQYADEIKNATSSLLDYEKNYNLDDPSDLNSCASYPRHVLALLSAGVNINDPAMQGLKNKMLTVCYQNNLYGLNGINDDVFGLIALLALNTSPTEPIIADIVSTTKYWQMDNGAFAWPDWMDATQKVAGDDITGAAVNALKYAQTKGVEINNEIFSKAKNYLKSTQQSDGGWGYGSSDIMTTSWVLMGINSLSESQNEWFNSVGKNPWHPLISQLKEGGFYESAWVPGTTDWFAMKHAVPALAGKFWPIILPEKIAHFETGPNITYSGGGSNYIPPVILATTTATTTLTETTTTLATTTLIATTTTETSLNNLSIQAVSSTPVSTTTKIIIKKPVKTTLKVSKIIPEVKGEKISANNPTSTTPITVAAEPPTKPENILTKSVKWILRVLKSLI